MTWLCLLQKYDIETTGHFFDCCKNFDNEREDKMNELENIHNDFIQ